MNLRDFIKGWIVGDFEPNVLRTKDFDFGVVHFYKGEEHVSHYHKISTEYNVVVTGRHRIGDKEYGPGDICIVRPMERSGYKCLQSGALAVLKVPTGKGDKYAD